MAMWSFGLLHLVSLFGYPSGTSVTTIWQRRLSSLGISLETYTFAFFNHACSVYIKLPFYWTFQKFSDKIVYHQHGRFYIGSTSITAAKRDFNRMAKLKQTLSDSAVHVELAIRYWASIPSDFEQFSTIVLRTSTLYQDTWIYEHLLISKWQAPLNFPFITEILKLKAKGWQLQYRRHNQQFPQSSTRRSIISKSEKKTPLSPKFHLGILISAYCVDYFVPFDSTRTDCL